MEPTHSTKNTGRPRVSIVIATWNAARTLERCIQSIRQQSFQEWELLIADGNSVDGTQEIIGTHHDIVAWWGSREDDGIYEAWNRGLERARGEYVCFLGADDAWASTTSLHTVFDAVGESAYDLVTAVGQFQNSETGKSFRFGSAWNYRKLGRRMVVCHPGMLHRRSLFEEYGMFDTQYRIAGDLEFLLRLPDNVRTLHVDTVTVNVEDAGVSRRNVLQRLREQRELLSRTERYGAIRAYLVWLDKLWRLPLAKLFDISH